MRITSKGQVTIPVEIREKAGLLPNTEVDFVISGADVMVVRREPDKHRKISRREQIVRRLRGSATSGMSTDEIMLLMRGES